jgi:chromosome segregation ATPase
MFDSPVDEIQKTLARSAPGPYHIKEDKLYAGKVELLTASNQYGMRLLEILGSDLINSLASLEDELVTLREDAISLRADKEELQYDLDNANEEISDLEAELNFLKKKE